MPHQIVSRLRSEQRPSLLVEIFLAEGEIEDALEAFTALRNRPEMMWNSALAMQVAEAAEESHPDEAIEIYIAEAEQAITGRNRAAYQAASHYLRPRTSPCCSAESRCAGSSLSAAFAHAITACPRCRTSWTRRGYNIPLG